MQLNYLAIGTVVIIRQILGFFWYSPMLFGNTWMQLIGITTEQAQAQGAKPFVIAILASIITAYLSAVLIIRLNISSITRGLGLGFLLWGGFAFSTLSLHYSFAGLPGKLLLIDTGYSLANFLIAGALLAKWK